MNNFDERISRFDLVMLKTTKHVNYLSASPGTKITPDGVWSVVAVIEQDLLIVKDQIVVRIPATDVIKIRDYEKEISNLLEKKDGQKTSRENWR